MMPANKPALKRNKYLKFFTSLAIFIFIVFILDFSIGHLLRYWYFRPDIASKNHVVYSMELTNEDMLFFGSSRAHRHYKSVIFEKKLGYTCYNNGFGGALTGYYYSVLKSTLKRYRPQTIVLDIRNEELGKEGDTYIYTLFPFYKTHPEIRPVINFMAPDEKYKLTLSQIYPFNSLIYRIVADVLRKGKDKEKETKGYAPLHRVWNEEIKTKQNAPEYAINSNRLFLFKSFIKDCRDSGIKLVFVRSPYFSKLTYEDYSTKVCMELATENNIKFYDFAADTTFTNHAELFSDQDHLNDRGAGIFSEMLADSLSETIKRKEANHQ